MYESTNSDKLRKLKQQLNLAYIAKENAAQRRETQVLKAIEKHDEASVAKVLRDYRNFQIQVDKVRIIYFFLFSHFLNKINKLHYENKEMGQKWILPL